MSSILRMQNPIQTYAWGSTRLLPRFLGHSSPASEPQAELWMGAHPKAPSQVWLEGGWHPLDRVIAQDPKAYLGPEVHKRFGSQLPFLFKVLAVAAPLSLQVHPNTEQARAGFDRENAQGIPLQAGERNYKDPNHKPECICALEPFWGLNGFRAPRDIVARFTSLAPRSLEPEVHILNSLEDAAALAGMLDSLLTMPNQRRQEAVEEVRANIDSTAETREPTDPVYWIGELIRHYPEDIGILAPAFLRLMHLEPGQAAYLPAGRIHAYLHGLGLEVMANSDNVLRCGLTPKHIDPGELMHIVDFDHREFDVLECMVHTEDVQAYPVLAEEFALSRISREKEGAVRIPASDGMEIILCTAGRFEIRDTGSDASVSMVQGQSVLVPAQVAQVEVYGQGCLYRVTSGNLDST